jgi:hypothetical protein
MFFLVVDVNVFFFFSNIYFKEVVFKFTPFLVKFTPFARPILCKLNFKSIRDVHGAANG